MDNIDVTYAKAKDSRNNHCPSSSESVAELVSLIYSLGYVSCMIQTETCHLEGLKI
jgi:hypothetical protein